MLTVWYTGGAKTLNDRVQACPTCGLVLDRNVSAVRNILQRGLQILQT